MEETVQAFTVLLNIFRILLLRLMRIYFSQYLLHFFVYVNGVRIVTLRKYMRHVIVKVEEQDHINDADHEEDEQAEAEGQYYIVFAFLFFVLSS